jgi:hypothetical protein
LNSETGGSATRSPPSDIILALAAPPQDALGQGREAPGKAKGSYARKAEVIKDEQDLDESVQRILDRMIFIRVCEDREIEPFALRSRMREWKGSGRTKSFYKLLIDVFAEFNTYYDSKLFKPHTSDKLEIDDIVMSSMINELYELGPDDITKIEEALGS